jgi:hypothetical protein
MANDLKSELCVPPGVSEHILGGMRKHLTAYVELKQFLRNIHFMYFRCRLEAEYNSNYTPTTLWYKVEEKLQLGVREQRGLVTGVLEVCYRKFPDVELSSRQC